MKKISICLLLFLCCARSLLAADFVIDNIDVQGLQRIQLGTVLNYLPVQVGQTIQTSDSGEVVKSLYDTGFFSRVNVKRKGNTLVIIVRERPTISSITITGNTEIPNKAMKESLKNIGLTEGHVYDVSILDNVKESLQNQYYDRGNYNAKVTTHVSAESQNRVAITIEVHEGPTAKIKEIKIIGNKAFSDRRLLNRMQLSSPRPWAIVTKQDQYSKEKLDADLEELRSFYLDEGYINFRIESTQVSITPDRKDVYIVVRVEEGEQFHLKGYKIANDMLFNQDELHELIELEPGEVFSRHKVTAIKERLTEYMAEHGYAFASVRPIPELDDETNEVMMVFVLEPGKRIYVRKIYFEGNTITEDHVLRREMRQQEAAVSSLSKVRLSEQRLNMTGYFKDVRMSTATVPGYDDLMDIKFTVKENPSASVRLGLGYSNTNKFLFNAGFTQPNFMGSGNLVAINFDTNRYTYNVSGSFYNPYYTPEGIGRGIKAYATVTDYDNSEASHYTSDQVGANIFYTLPMSEYHSLSFGYGLQITNLHIPNRAPAAERVAAAASLSAANRGLITLTDGERKELNHNIYKGSSLELERFKDKFGDRFRNLLLTGSWSYANLDRAIFPTKGMTNFVDGMVALPVDSNSLGYYKANAGTHIYYPLFKGFIITARGEVGYGNGFIRDDELPFYENYLAGGLGVQGGIRGYKGYTVGPKDSWEDTIGGNFLVDGSLGLIVPLPFAQDVLRTTLFVDAGNVFTDVTPIVDPVTPFSCASRKFNSPRLRTSAGLMAEWRSPIGPLVVSFAKVMDKQRCDEVDTVQFTVGTNL